MNKVFNRYYYGLEEVPEELPVPVEVPEVELLPEGLAMPLLVLP